MPVVPICKTAMLADFHGNINGYDSLISAFFAWVLPFERFFAFQHRTQLFAFSWFH